MTLLFNRDAELIIGPSAGMGYKFKGLRMAFDLSKTSESKPNTAKIQVYNMSKTSRSIIETKNQVAVLRVGYSVYKGKEDIESVGSLASAVAPTLENLFAGNVTKVMWERKGADVITNIECGDGEKAIKETTINKSFGPGTLGVQVFTEVATAMGLILNPEALALIGTEIFQHGLSLSGSCASVLDDLTSKVGVEWSIQDGELKVLKPGMPTLDSAVFLTPETGLLGEPSKQDSEGLDKKVSTIVTVKCLLNPKIRPGRMVNVVSKKLTGFFRTRKADFKGDTHQGDWITLIEAVQPNG